MTAKEMADKRWANTPKGEARKALAQKAARARWKGHKPKPKRKAGIEVN